MDNVALKKPESHSDKSPRLSTDPNVEARIKGNFNPGTKMDYVIEELMIIAKEEDGVEISDSRIIQFGKGKFWSQYFPYGLRAHYSERTVRDFSDTGDIELVCYKKGSDTS